jgi:hypothetical protein
MPFRSTSASLVYPRKHIPVDKSGWRGMDESRHMAADRRLGVHFVRTN